jgi:hypothetical protein
VAKFQPGQSGNPKGRPAKREKYAGPINRAEKSIAEKLPDLVNRLIDLADEGDRQALMYLLDRILGKPTQREEVTGEQGGPITIRVEYGDE